MNRQRLILVSFSTTVFVVMIFLASGYGTRQTASLSKPETATSTVALNPVAVVQPATKPSTLITGETVYPILLAAGVGVEDIYPHQITIRFSNGQFALATFSSPSLNGRRVSALVDLQGQRVVNGELPGGRGYSDELVVDDKMIVWVTEDSVMVYRTGWEHIVTAPDSVLTWERFRDGSYSSVDQYGNNFTVRPSVRALTPDKIELDVFRARVFDEDGSSAQIENGSLRSTSSTTIAINLPKNWTEGIYSRPLNSEDAGE